MKYLCLIYDEEKKLGGMSKSESDAFMGEYFAFTEAIRKSGHYIDGQARRPAATRPLTPCAAEPGSTRRSRPSPSGSTPTRATR